MSKHAKAEAILWKVPGELLEKKGCQFAQTAAKADHQYNEVNILINGALVVTTGWFRRIGQRPLKPTSSQLKTSQW